jgi:hypothetical protein
MKAEISLKRECGTQIRLVAEDCTMPWSDGRQFGIYAVVTDTQGEIKVVDTNDARPIPKGMSVEEYKTSPERGLFGIVTYAEYFRVCNLLHAKIDESSCNFIVN